MVEYLPHISNLKLAGKSGAVFHEVFSVGGFLKIILIGHLAILMMSFNLYAANENAARPKIALVLSGGGAKGFAHIGVLKVLEEEGIPVDIIVGTSMGSLIGGLYSIGYNASELENLVKTSDWELVLTDNVPRTYLSANDQMIKQRYLVSLPYIGQKKIGLPESLVKGQNVLNVFCGLAGNVPYDADFEKFPVKFACVAANLETGKEVIIKNGFLPTAMYASMAIPAAFQSIERDSLLLVDGGVVNNFPADVAKNMGADIIIGVDLSSLRHDRNYLKSMYNVLAQVFDFLDQEKDSVNRNLCNVLIRPDITGYSMSSFSRKAADTLILRGEAAADKCREQLREIKKKYGLQPRTISRAMVQPDHWHITGLTLSGSYELDEAVMRKTLDLKIPGNYTADEIKNAIDRLYGLGGFERIYYNLIDTGDGETLNLNITGRKVFTQNLGFKVNTTDAAAILLNVTRKNYQNIFSLLSASAELSANPGISMLAESNKLKFPTVGLSAKAKYQHYNIFENGEKISKSTLFYTSGSLYCYQPFMHSLTFGLGLQEEYYSGDYFSSGSNPQPTGNEDFLLTNAYSYLSFDNMDNFYFPAKGTNMYAEFSLNADFQKSRELNPAALFKVRNVIPLQKKTALLFDLYGRALFSEGFPPIKVTFVGGEPWSQYFNYHLPFVGLPAVNIARRFTYIGLIGLRVNVAGPHYVSVLFNGMWQYNDIGFSEGKGAVYGSGLKYSMKTPLGPVDMTLGYSKSNENPTFSANFGYWF
jgi:NTE family protein